MIFDYESELYPVGSEKMDFDWYKKALLSLPTDKLREKYDEYEKELDKLRGEEPAKKRNKKSDYRIWLRRTHDITDLLNEIIQELKSR